MSRARAPLVFTGLLVAGVTGWLALVVVTPAWQGAPDGGGLRTLALTFRVACTRVCHQRPDRSFHTNGQPWPVCARCTGLYVGAAAGGWIALLAALQVRRRTRSSRAETWRWPLLLAGMPTAATWALEYAGAMSFSNGARFALALPLGVVGAWLVASMASGRVE